jgi:hypothetical protein
MKIQDLIDLFRKQLGDVAKPQLWDDIEVMQYLIDAQDMYVRLIGGIADSTTAAVVNVPVVTDQAISEHCPYILRIRSAKLLTAKRKVTIASEADLSQIGILQNSTLLDYGLIRPPYLDDTDTGDVIAGVLGVQKNAIRWYKVPVADDTCVLNVYRLPYPRIEDVNGCIEIDEQHHINLLYWMKHRAYSKEDGETYDKDLAATNDQLFRRYCADAKQEEERQRFKPRVVQYGGIPW